MKPILVLQMRRLGDLILTFPLILDLARRFPENPVWVVAEPQFFQPLLALAPNVVFFPPSHLPQLGKENYELVINLSSQPEAAICAQTARADLKLGSIQTETSTNILGFWQLYRAALTQNNRHNLFHWSDLNRLDLEFPLPVIKREAFSLPGKRRIGLFIGASEAAKRPEPQFWVALARRLIKKDCKPVLLGGPGEAAAGGEIAARTQIANFCGKTSLNDLAALITTLDLFITPDTGPMHLADWLGARVLNLSLGNVQPFETGPLLPGQWILQANMSCAGCWSCQRSRQFCKDAFSAEAVANFASGLLEKKEMKQSPHLRILGTNRSENGLFHVEQTGGAPRGANLLDDFWQKAFIYFYDQNQKAGLMASAKNLREKAPVLAASLSANLDRMLATSLRSLKTASQLPSDFWRSQPAHSSLFAGFTQMNLQNADFSTLSWRQSLERLEFLREIFKA